MHQMAAPPFRVLLADYSNSDGSAEIPFLFKKAGCRIEAYCTPESWLLKSRYHDQWHPASGSDPAAYAEGLCELVRTRPYDWVVLLDEQTINLMNDWIPGGDKTLAAHILPLSKLQHRALLGSKAALSRLSHAHGLVTPAFFIYTGETDADLLAAAAAVSFPLLLKVDHSGGGKGVFFCADAEAVKERLRSMSDEQKEDLVFQKYIAGDNISVEALYRGGILLAYACSRVLTNVGGEFGVSTARHYGPDAAMQGQLQQIGSALGMHGFCSLTFMREADTGACYMVEADMRPHAWFALARFCGVDFSAAIQRYLLHTTDQPPLSQSAPAREVRHFSRDLNRSLHARDFRNLVRWGINADGRWRYIPWHDRRLFFATIKRVAQNELYRHTAAYRLYTYMRARWRGTLTVMNKQFLKDTLGWGFFIWLGGYILGFVLFAFVPTSLIGWVIMPVGTVLTLWVLLKKIHCTSFPHYISIALVWALIAVVFDYLFLVLLLKPADGYYKLDVYVYYALTLLLPLGVGWYKHKTQNHV